MSPEGLPAARESAAPERRRIAVLVAGMHRSGTSAVARLLNLLGCDLPKTLMPAGIGNEAGHWESIAVSVLNDAILAAHGATWDDWRAIDPGWFETTDARAFRSRCLEVLAEEFGASPLFVLKDPRLCRLLPLWLPVLETAAIEPRVVIPVRNPFDVAASLQARNEMEPGFAQLLWLRHALDAEFGSRGVARVFVRYDEVLGDWRASVSSLGAALDLSWPRDVEEVASDVAAFLRPSLRHHDVPDSAVLDDQTVAGWIRETFAILDAACRDRHRPLDTAALDRVRTALGEADPLFRPVVERAREDVRRAVAHAEALSAEAGTVRAQCAELEAAIRSSEQELVSEREFVREREREILALRGDVERRDLVIAEREKMLAAASDLVAQCNLSLSEQRAVLSERDSTIARLEAALAHREAALAQREAALAQRDTALAQRDTAVAQRDTAVTQRDAAVSEHEIRLSLREDDLQQARQRGAELERALAERESAFALERRERDAEIAGLREDVEGLRRQRNVDAQVSESELARRAETIATLEATVIALRSSTSWRITAPLRFVRRMAGRVGSRPAFPPARAAGRTAAERRLMSGAGGSRATLRRLAEAVLPKRLVDRVVTWRVARTIVVPSGLFDSEWYLARNPDVRTKGADPVRHYLVHGWREGRDPHPQFSTSGYLDRYLDVRMAGSNPLVHYLLHGRAEGRSPRPDVWRPPSSLPSGDGARPPLSEPPDRTGSVERRPGTASTGLAGAAKARALRYIVARHGGDSAAAYGDLFDAAAGEAGDREADLERRLLARARSAAQRASAAEPEVSVVVPMFDNVLVTLACAVSVLEVGSRRPFELVIADDCSPDARAELFGTIGGCVRHVRQATNLGFLRNCNRAAAETRGACLVFLNNDTLVLPGWLDALIDLLDEHADVGLVGSKLLNADATLQEAGGIFWRDGSAWNYGRGQEPGLPEFNYRKEVDYVSGAAMALRRSVWDRLSGFDEAFAPAYCEDADLAFRVRAEGLSVVYQPRSEVFHLEGLSHGREIGTGIKAFQTVNQRKLHERWRAVLEEEHFDSGTDVVLARDRSRNRVRILVVDHYVPQWDRDAGSRTMHGFMKMLVERGFHVAFWPDNLHEDPEYTPALQDLGVEVIYSASYRNRFPEWFAERAGHTRYVLLSRPHVAEKYIGEVKQHPGVKVLYYGHDLHHRRMAGEYRLEPSESLMADIEAMRDCEYGIVRRADVSLYPSQEEVDVLRAALPSGVRVEPVPAYVFDEADLAAGAAALDRHMERGTAELLFVGGYRHGPNVDAVLWFAEAVMPELRRIATGVRFHIVGSNVPAAVAALAGPDIVVHGRVSDDALTRLYAEADLVVAPLRFGGGVKGKVVEAMAKGRPIATTSIGAQGIDDPEAMLFLGEDAGSFASAVRHALADRDEAVRRARRGLDFVRRHYTAEAVAASFASFMPELSV